MNDVLDKNGSGLPIAVSADVSANADSVSSRGCIAASSIGERDGVTRAIEPSTIQVDDIAMFEPLTGKFFGHQEWLWKQPGADARRHLCRFAVIHSFDTMTVFAAAPNG